MASKIGILTGGGDCPGLNAVIRAVVRKAINEGYEVVGIKNGWKGLIEKDTMALTLDSISGILPKGGTILGTSRTNPYKKEGAVQKVVTHYKSLGLDALVAVGGEDTLGVATKLVAEKINVVGVPKTIDNDLSATDYTFGFDTAINIATECIDRLHTTAESHHRIIVAEVMGRHAGWIALEAGIAGGADVILIPEIPIDIDEVCGLIKKRHSRGKTFSIVVVAEGAQFKKSSHVLQEQKLDEFGHVRLGGIGELLAREIEKQTGYETRVSVLGHIQRGGSPSAFDRVLGTRFGVKAVELVLQKKFGRMVALSGGTIIDVPLEAATGKLKTVDTEYYELAKVFFG
ncbi:MAG: pyrophosphate--fructose-6-phosphate 1-phosphotransferase [Omnitrophica WOR_2 bacterium GWF2_43_52]|nr:MAG: pyrophosphate--fructose-6-phosphate 1-phosphotransferase [Omnitrophica WOR_2 bacterium GWA2_44_7]OGX15027.1 MAG: pyrophosphate--fructose-6-phosphate 1-phosphotransferase [Omnitrophica WOR_2 bacterium GWC2_44_8]OGX22584.1 MAG: pyrophosphate--fructose-6-phosphate 1-phosphotransferase [Omnitrophica WOR_2 bacterium GWF2_43_52]HAH21409.1 6-phosphofructokinase [Candidatus Omnitrophota bacterium]HBG64675.1 6-phosphofructokinase [Candidatus Omnitrophota bacterium]